MKPVIAITNNFPEAAMSKLSSHGDLALNDTGKLPIGVETLALKLTLDPSTFSSSSGVEPASPEAVRLVEALRSIALDMPTLNPHFLPRWAEGWFE